MKHLMLIQEYALDVITFREMRKVQRTGPHLTLRAVASRGFITDIFQFILLGDPASREVVSTAGNIYDYLS